MMFAEVARTMTVNTITDKLVDKISWEVVESVQSGILDAIDNGQFSWRYCPEKSDLDTMEYIKEWLELLGYNVIRNYQKGDNRALEINWRNPKC